MPDVSHQIRDIIDDLHLYVTTQKFFNSRSAVVHDLADRYLLPLGRPRARPYPVYEAHSNDSSFIASHRMTLAYSQTGLLLEAMGDSSRAIKCRRKYTPCRLGPKY
jgi:hypothetical protein